MGILAQAMSGAAGSSGSPGGTFNETSSKSSQAGLVGSVSITHIGTISTGPSPAPTPGATLSGPGAASHGFLAQAVAGGGRATGAGGSILTGLGGTADTNPNLANGGNVGVVSSGDISTGGSVAHGILAQSVGGGGGKAASALQQQIRLPLDISFNAAADTSGVPANSDGGTSQVNLGGGVLSTGQNAPGESAGYGAYGVLVQSVGGGGGLIIDGSQQAQETILLGQNVSGGGVDPARGGWPNWPPWQAQSIR